MRIVEEILELSNSTKSVFSNTSSIWNEIIGRSKKNKKKGFSQNILKESNFLKNNGCMPDYSESGDQLFFDRFRGAISNKDISELKFPKFGNPKYLTIDDNKIPISHFFKLSTFFYINEALEIQGYEKKNLKCAEIGAGWGCIASLLIEQSYLSSYTDIDLPETLSIAAFYLTKNFPKLSYKLQTKTKTNPTFFTFSTPQFVNYIDEKYDLIINEASLSEMPKETASAYLNWVEDHLKKNGIFIWQNGRNRSNSPHVTIKMSDYDLARFKPLLLKPQRGRAIFQNDTALFIAATLNDEGFYNKNLNLYFEVLTQLSDIGITDDVISIYENIPKNSLNKNQIDFIKALDVFFDSGNLEKLIKFYNNSTKDKLLRMSISYIIGIKEFLDGNTKEAKRNLEEYLQYGISPVALAFSTAIYRANKWKILSYSPISYLKKKLVDDYHWPDVIKRENLNTKQLKGILKSKLRYPWKIKKRKYALFFKIAKKIFRWLKSLFKFVF